MSGEDVRHRCLTVGCNPYLGSLAEAESHKSETGHRIAKWPVRSKAGERRAMIRNRSGYYNKYNFGNKSYSAFQKRVNGTDYLSHDDYDDYSGGEFSADGPFEE